MTINGYVFDATTGQRIPAATVEVLSNGIPTGEGAVADSNGNYSLSVADPDSSVKISSIGYNPVLAHVSDADEISLFPATNQLPGVTVTAQAAQTAQTPAKNAWQAIKPAIPWVIGAFALGYIITSYHDNQKKKNRR